MRSPNTNKSFRSPQFAQFRNLAAARLSPANCALGWLLGLVLIVASGSLRDAPTARPVVSTGMAASSGSASTGAWIPSESEWGEQLRATKFASSRSGGSSTSGSASGVSYTPALRSGLTKALPLEYGQPGAQRASLPLRSKERRDGDDDSDNRKKSKSSSKSKDQDQNSSDDGDDDGEERKSSSKTYRTMCVRLCDGYYWPVNYAVTKDQFKDDANACARTCGGPGEAKLFTYRNPGSEIEDMEDSDGRAYKKLQNAFLFRTKYEASCKCRPHPWEDASADRHKAYTFVADARKGDRVAQQKLKELRIKLQVEAQTALKAKAAQMPGKGKAATLVRVPDLAPTAEPAEVPTAAGLALPVVVVKKPSVIRGDLVQSGHLRVSRPRTASGTSHAVAGDVPQSRVVRVRLGGRNTKDFTVSSRWQSKEADAADGTVVKR